MSSILNELSSNVLEGLDSIRRESDLSIFVNFIRDTYGAKHVVYHTHNFPGYTLYEPYVYLTYPDAWVQRYKDRNYFHVDPIFKKSFDAVMPIDWVLIDKSDQKVNRFFKDASNYDVGGYGISIPTRGPAGYSALFTINFDCDDDLHWEELRSHHLVDWMMLAHFFHAKVIDIKAPQARMGYDLSTREVECVYWAAEGNTNTEIASKLKISPNTVRMFLDSARHKTNSLNKAHLVANCIKNRIIV